MDLRRFCVLFLLGFCQFSALADYNSTCPNFCEWGPAQEPQLGGGSCESHNFKECTAEARMVFIGVDSLSEDMKDLKTMYRSKKSVVIFTDRTTSQKITCDLIPLKAKYDPISTEDLKEDLAAHDGQVSEEFLNRLDQNIGLECMMM